MEKYNLTTVDPLPMTRKTLRFSQFVEANKASPWTGVQYLYVEDVDVAVAFNFAASRRHYKRKIEILRELVRKGVSIETLKQTFEAEPYLEDSGDAHFYPWARWEKAIPLPANIDRGLGMAPNGLFYQHRRNVEGHSLYPETDLFRVDGDGSYLYRDTGKHEILVHVG